MENKGLKILVHASAFYMPYLIPLIVFLVTKDHSVKKTAIQAVLFQVMMSIVITISTILMFVLIGIPLLIVFGIIWAVVPIIAIVKTLNDVDYNYPIVGVFYR